MAEQEETPEKKSSKMPMILGLVLAVMGGAGGYYAVSSGMILGGESENAHGEEPSHDAHDAPAVAFVEMDPLLINLQSNGQNHYLRFSAQLEVDPAYQDEVTMLLPRVTDVLNGYLRAVAVADLMEPSALTLLRSQMLRRVQLVTGEGRVRDLLVMEFVVN